MRTTGIVVGLALVAASDASAREAVLGYGAATAREAAVASVEAAARASGREVVEGAIGAALAVGEVPSIASLGESPTDEGLRALAVRLRLDGITVVARSRDGRALLAQRWDATAGRATRVESVEGPPDASARTLWLKLGAAAPDSSPSLLLAALDGNGNGNGNGNRVTKASRAPSVPFYRRAWLWVGVLAVGAGAVLLGGLLYQPPPPSGSLRIDGAPFTR